MELLGFTIQRKPRAITGSDPEVLELAVHKLALRVKALEDAAQVAQLERAEWLSKLTRLYNSTRTKLQRAEQKEEQAAMLEPPVAIAGKETIDVLAMRRRG